MIVGAILGGIIGNAVEREAQRARHGVELTVRLDHGRMIAVVQDDAGEAFRPGDRVRVLSDGMTAPASRAMARDRPRTRPRATRRAAACRAVRRVARTGVPRARGRRDDGVRVPAVGPRARRRRSARWCRRLLRMLKVEARVHGALDARTATC